ncbi:CRISPR-associated endoribonuclease Cas6 [Hornefia butyriciproducens]|uniref:CRISPR-associated endoribonuclease Cas6 n=2 Tax=Hornefia butyriciproducens TaxID=2652293 RepID=UPI003F8C1898
MLSKLIISLESREDSPRRMNYSFGSLMQGVLMEHVAPDFAEFLHTGGVNPYAQYLELRDGAAAWNVTTLTAEAREQIILPMLNSQDTELRIRHHDMELKIRSKAVEEKTYEKLMEETYFGRCKPYLTLEFITPTAFKVDGEYQFYPTVFHIFQSLIRKYDAVSGETEIFSEELMKEITEHVHITRYNLRSCIFGLEGVKVPGFRGQISLRIHGPQMFVNLIHMLAAFGTFSGVGIKTSMGMGAVRLRDHSTPSGALTGTPHMTEKA